MKQAQVSTAARPHMTAAEDTLVVLLGEVRQRFYAQCAPSLFYCNRRALVSALTWSAEWLDRRGVYCTQARYRVLLIARMEAIEEHGDAGKMGAFFPAYLLKCIQDWFAWHGEDLYLELKHARNAMEVALLSIAFDDENSGNPLSCCAQREPIEALASLHRVLVTRKASGKRQSNQEDQILLKLS